jgi:hypothetical protein
MCADEHELTCVQSHTHSHTNTAKDFELGRAAKDNLENHQYYHAWHAKERALVARQQVVSIPRFLSLSFFVAQTDSESVHVRETNNWSLTQL